MSKVDDELTRLLRRAERPVGGDDLFEGLERRRSHRERLRKVQAGMLAFAVLAATAGGFAVLREAFRPDDRDPVASPSPGALSANGEIVFVKDGEDSRLHIYAAQADGSGERQITEGSTNDSDPAVSPDGQTVAFAHTLDQGDGAVIATVPIEGGPIEWQTAAHHDVSDPAWSSDGTHIAFIGYTDFSADLYVAEVNGSRVRRIDVRTAARFESDGLISSLVPSDPSWSPDGSWIAFAAMISGDALPSSHLARIRQDGTAFEWLATDVGATPDEFAPAWSPDGTQIAFLRDTEFEESEETATAHEIWTIEPDGGGESLIASADEGSLTLDIAWAPDATSLLVSDGTWISRVDPSPTGDPGVNFVRVVQGFSPSWQPLPAGSDPSPTPTREPSISPDPEPSGHDIGLGFRLCHLHPLGGLDLLGDGPVNKAWTGSRVSADGRCSDEPDPRYGVAVDLTGDGLADAWSGETIEFCFMCRPFAGVDLDADGDDELAVMTSEGSVPSFEIYAATVIGGEPRVAPILVARPGHPSASHPADEPLTFSSGGDEGFAAWVRCGGFPSAPVLITTWRSAPIEGEMMEVHETAFVLQEDGRFHVVDTTDYEAPVSDPIPNVSDAPACGVDWQLWD